MADIVTLTILDFSAFIGLPVLDEVRRLKTLARQGLGPPQRRRLTPTSQLHRRAARPHLGGNDNQPPEETQDAHQGRRLSDSQLPVPIAYAGTDRNFYTTVTSSTAIRRTARSSSPPRWASIRT